VSPEIIAPLRAPIATLPGLGLKLASLIAKLVGGDTLRDVLFHLPIDFLDRRAVTTIAAAQPGAIATLRIDVIRHEIPAKKSQPHRVVIGDVSGFAEIVLFHAARLTQFPIGAKLLISGKMELFADRKTMPHPDFVLPLAQEANFPWIEPVWPLSAGVVPRIMRRAALGALAVLPDFPEWHDASILRVRQWPGFAAASYCLLLHDDKLGVHTRKRLAFLKQTEDGFLIADEDFRLRGGGDFLGTKQSGLPGYRLADPEVHDDLLPMARQDAVLILQRDPKLESERGKALRVLLQLFEQREAIQTVRAG
jgi:ATP-dependent DNA helicase RecG